MWVEQRCREYDGILSDLAERLTATTRVAVECEYRLYLSARMRLNHLGPEFYDPKGYRTDLIVWSKEGTAAAEAAISTWNKHFDDLWLLARRPQWRQGTAV